MATTRSVLAPVVLALALAVPSISEAQSSRNRSSQGGTHLAGLLGLESGFGDTAAALRVDGEWDLQPLNTGRLGFVGSLGLTFFGDDAVDVNTLKLGGAARWTIPASPKIDLYADAGLGLYVATVDFDDRFEDDDSDTEVGLFMRFAGGILFPVASNLRLGAEVGINPYFGELDDTTLSLMGVLSMRL